MKVPTTIVTDFQHKAFRDQSIMGGGGVGDKYQILNIF